jgi:hypothetical protein
MADYTMLQEIEYAKIGLAGASEGACTDVGSMESISIEQKVATEYATDASMGGAQTKARSHSPDLTMKMTMEYWTAANLARATGGTVSGTKLQIGSGLVGPRTAYTIYAKGMCVKDEILQMLHAWRMVILPQTVIEPKKEQSRIEIECQLLADKSQSAPEWFYTLDNSAADTTPPTVASTDPADNATSVARTKVVAITFSEAIRGEDVNWQHFSIYKVSDHTLMTGNWSVQDAGGTIVQFTHGSQFGATTEYQGCAKAGIHDLAGNQLAEDFMFSFTTTS